MGLKAELAEARSLLARWASAYNDGLGATHAYLDTTAFLNRQLPTTAPHNGTQPSRRAAMRLQLGGARRRVLEAVIAYGPATSAELESRTNMKHQTVSARLNELRHANMVRIADVEPGRRGSWRHVVTPDGLKALGLDLNEEVPKMNSAELKKIVQAQHNTRTGGEYVRGDVVASESVQPAASPAEQSTETIVTPDAAE